MTYLHIVLPLGAYNLGFLRLVLAGITFVRSRLILGFGGMATGCRTIILAGLALGGVVLPDFKVNDAGPVQDSRIQPLGVNAEPFGALRATIIAKQALSDADAGPTRLEELGEPGERETTVANSLQMRAQESPPAQIAALTTLDQVHHDARDEPNDIKGADECLASELCIDQYLWSLYQRARKVDTIKVVEQKKTSVVKKGKLRTIIQNIVKLVSEDFTWKDPAAAEKAGMPEMEYVIGGRISHGRTRQRQKKPVCQRWNTLSEGWIGASSCDCVMLSTQWTRPGLRQV
jgi:hypothetical protein